MTLLGNGLFAAGHSEDALSVEEAKVSLLQRLIVPERVVLAAQSNLATTYQKLGRLEEAIHVLRDVYAGYLKLAGEDDPKTIAAAINYAWSLGDFMRYKEAKSLMHKTMAVARRVLGESHDYTLRTRCLYAMALYNDDGSTLDNLREAVTTLEETQRIARRVFGKSHPRVANMERALRRARATLRACETPPSSA